ncbi:YceI family protein [Mucilaginibacter pedocola]|uniref:Lipid/polyisoprenoid-binding YceI-like domain-containing protein n=1 Tax=Mucilaginibacter pedocola TaxID=1792845 RepID=A0A1S9P6F8_9SPHI|nr:YceI family protein [Mucilaginibacter pedocola]OOQ56540.1 hypothetical protein BC343_19065 [Mucilaginibacter pedocola]
MIKKTTLALLLLLLATAPVFAQQHYRLDVKKSKLLWKVATIGNHNGYLLFNDGRMDVTDKGEPITGYFTMDMKSIRSQDGSTAADRAKVDKEITTPGFFDTEAYPTATMEVKQITPTGNAGVYRIKGNLTIKGISNPVELSATIGKNGDTITAKADAGIDRSKWRIDFHEEKKGWDPVATLKDNLISNDIAVTLDLTFTKQ